MGIKTFKEKFGIEHIVCKTQKGICIGSPYIHDLAVISPETGKISTKIDFRSMLLKAYPELLAVEGNEILELLNSNDVFEKSLPVYAFIDGQIVEKFCEEYGWPNITHDGLLMYENEFFKSKLDAIHNAIKNCKRSIKCLHERIMDYEARINEAKKSVKEEQAILSYLNEMLYSESESNE